MKHILSGKWTVLVLLLVTSLSWGQGAHRLGQVIVRGNNVQANIAPFAKILVCAPGTFCNTTATIYSDQALTHVKPQPVTADASGNYDYYLTAGCVDERISQPGLGSVTVTNVCPYSGSGGGQSGFPIIFGSTSIGAGSTTTSVSGLTVNGVTPTTFGFLDPTSSVQTQLNSKAHTFTLTTSGSSGPATYSGDTLNIPQYSGGGGSGTVTAVSVTTANGVSGSVANSTTTPAITLTLGAITPTSTNGVSAATLAFMSGVTSAVQTQLNTKVTHTVGVMTAGFLVLGNSAGDIKASTTLDDGVTTAGTITSTEPIAVASAGASSITLAGAGPNYTQITVNLFSTLPTCNSGQEGTLAPISDSTTVTGHATISGGGSNHTLGYCNGTNWVVGY